MHYYDKNGEEITLEQYVELFGDFEYKRIELTEVGPYQVSTVWLGLDHNFLGGPPLIFETMVFTSDSWEGKELLLDLECQRYSTEEEARKGHAEYVALIRATTPEIPDGLEKEADGEHQQQQGKPR